jgi:hypothetical protein
MQPLAVSVLVLSIARLGAAVPLTSSVVKLSPEPAVVITARSAGATPLERFRAATRALSARTPLVALVRLATANQPDVVTVADARRDGTKITIVLENRRFEGPLSKNIVWEPLVEIELGALEPGDYAITIDERVLSWDKDPQHAKLVGAGLSHRGTYTIR